MDLTDPRTQLRLAAGELAIIDGAMVEATGKKRVYIAGPMSNLPEHNFPMFDAAAACLRELGYVVFNPADIACIFFKGNTEQPPNLYLREDIPTLLFCDAICVLPGFDRSTGAKLEVAIALTMRLEFLCFYPYDETRDPKVGVDAFIASYEAPESVTITDGYRGDPRWRTEP
jgi:uncharacterized protein DUF4406